MKKNGLSNALALQKASDSLMPDLGNNKPKKKVYKRNNKNNRKKQLKNSRQLKLKKENKIIKQSVLSKHLRNPKVVAIYEKLRLLHYDGVMNKYYAGLAEIVKNSNNNKIKQSLQTVKYKLSERLKQKYKSSNLSLKRQVKKDEINEIISMIDDILNKNNSKKTNNSEITNNRVRLIMNRGFNKNTATNMVEKLNNHQYGGSQVRGRRVLKNGAIAGYVKQSNGTWKWSFLSKKRN